MAVVLALLLSNCTVLFLLAFCDLDLDLSIPFISLTDFPSFSFCLIIKWRLLTDGLFCLQECFFVVLASSFILKHETLDFLLSYIIFVLNPSSILLLLRLIFLLIEFLLMRESLSCFFPVESKLSRLRLLASLLSG